RRRRPRVAGRRTPARASGSPGRYPPAPAARPLTTVTRSTVAGSAGGTGSAPPTAARLTGDRRGPILRASVSVHWRRTAQRRDRFLGRDGMTSVRALSRSSRFHRGGVVAVVALALVAGGCGPRWGELTVASPPVTAEWAHARFSDVSCVRTAGSRWCVAVGTQTTGG